MCGIGGIILRNEQTVNFSTELLTNKINIITNAQVRRGPDSSKVVVGKKFAFSHNRLAIIDLSETGTQPMVIGDWLIVFNGEIYNYKELKEVLINENINFQGTSDTEVLLNYFIKFGIDKTLEDINGIFSFCIYNQINGEFYCARDRLGEKPFFYYLDESNNFYFSSNPAAIVKSCPEIEWKLDKEALWQFFELGGFFTQKTLFCGIQRLDSSCVIKGNKNKFEISRYWQPRYISNLNSRKLINQVKKSIYSRTVSDVPIVLFLSGGVDSSTIATVLRNIDAVHLFSPEVEHADKVANIYDINLQIIKPNDFDIRKVTLDYCEFAGEPTMAGFIPYITSESVSKTHKVALTANGADELFFGYARIPTPNINPKKLQNKKTELNVNPKKLKKKKTKSNLSVDRTHSEQIFHIFRHPDNFDIPILGHKKTVKDLTDLLNSSITKLSDEFPQSSQFRWFELMTYVKGDLNLTLDYASMANSLEVRAPFLDHELVEKALSLDENKHITVKYGRKHFLKVILDSDKIPSSVWNREKIGFSLTTSYRESVNDLKDEALRVLSQEGYLDLHCNSHKSGRDKQYLGSAAFGFYCWKQIWVDSGIVKI